MKNINMITILFILLTSQLLITGCSKPFEFDPRKMDWPDNPPKIIKITGGSRISLALDENGFVWTWGFTSFANWKDDHIKGAGPVWNEDGSQFGNIKSQE